MFGKVTRFTDLGSTFSTSLTVKVNYYINLLIKVLRREIQSKIDVHDKLKFIPEPEIVIRIKIKKD